MDIVITSIIVSSVFFAGCFFTYQYFKNRRKKITPFYELDWYKKEFEKFNGRYFIPPARNHCELQDDETYLKFIQYYKPIHFDGDYGEKEPWFVEVYHLKGRNKIFITRYQGSL